MYPKIYRTVKILNIGTPKINTVILLKTTLQFNNAAMGPKDPLGMANSVNPDQTAHLEQSDQGLHCLLMLICSSV